MVGFAPTMWKMAHLPNNVALRNCYQDEDRTDNIPKFVKQYFGPPQKTQPSGSNDTWSSD